MAAFTYIEHVIVRELRGYYWEFMDDVGVCTNIKSITYWTNYFRSEGGEVDNPTAKHEGRKRFMTCVENICLVCARPATGLCAIA